MRLGGRAVRRPCGRIHLWEEGRSAVVSACMQSRAWPVRPHAPAPAWAIRGNQAQSSAIQRNPAHAPAPAWAIRGNQAQSSAIKRNPAHAPAPAWAAVASRGGPRSPVGKGWGRCGEHLHAATCRASLTHLLRRREVDRRVQESLGLRLWGKGGGAGVSTCMQ